MKEQMTWQELPIGGVIVEAGNSVEYVTGGWRAFRPVIDFDRCTHCLFCWLYCPDASMQVSAGKLTGVDLLHCKGCGICAAVCPPQVITMVAEAEFAEVRPERERDESAKAEKEGVR